MLMGPVDALLAIPLVVMLGVADNPVEIRMFAM